MAFYPTDKTRECDQLGRPSNPYWFYENTKCHQTIGDYELEVDTKAAILKVSPSVVGITAFGVPPKVLNVPYQCEFEGSGFVIESEHVQDHKFDSIVLTTSNLFTRIEGTKLNEIRVEVRLANGTSCAGEVIACDFHYNLAALRIHSSAPLQPASLEDLDDVLSFTSSHSQALLRPHSTQVKIRPHDTLVALGRKDCGKIFYTLGAFSNKYPELDCKELYSITVKHEDQGGPVVNRHGQVLGMMMIDDYFLPGNIISRWWKYYKLNKCICRPWLGVVRVANFHAGRVDFLEKFLQKFPNVDSGVIVTTVTTNSAAYYSGLRHSDVIVECNGSTVRSTMEFFERVWVKAGACVELTLLRLSSAEHVKITVEVGEAVENNYHNWPIAPWYPMQKRRRVSESKLEARSDSEAAEGSDSEMDKDLESDLE